MAKRFERLWRPGVSCALILVLVGASLQAWLHPDQGHDIDWPATVVDDISHERVSAVPVDEADQADHCAVCHFSRAARGHAAKRTAGHQASAASPVVSHAPRVILSAGAVGPLAARAPPTLG